MKEFTGIKKELDDFDVKREETIRVSRDVIRLSKHIIYSVHRDDLVEACKLVKDIKKKIKLLDKNKSYDTGISFVAFQEFVEAVVFYEFIKTGKLVSKKSLKVSAEAYLSGLADLSGELVRKAVKDSINNNLGSVDKIRKLVGDIYGEFLKLNLRNGELRKKSDAIKWNLNKLEDIIFSLKLRK